MPKARAKDAGLGYDRFIWRMKKDLYDEATDLILERSTSAETLGRPEAWAERRAVLARYLMRNGRAQEAYRVAANHHLPTGSGASSYADLEFLAGFIALRRLNDPGTALKHFQHLLAGVTTPISLARAQYWIGRAARGGRAGRLGQLPGRSGASDGVLRASGRRTAGSVAGCQGLLAKPATPDWRGAGLHAILGACRGNRDCC